MDYYINSQKKTSLAHNKSLKTPRLRILGPSKFQVKGSAFPLKVSIKISKFNSQIDVEKILNKFMFKGPLLNVLKNPGLTVFRHFIVHKKSTVKCC